jgi:hypothetical protein
MSDDTTRNTPPPPGPDPDKDTPDLTAELREMGQQLEAAFRAMIESDRAKQLQRDLAGGVRELTAQVNHAVKNLQTNPRVQQAEERGRQAIHQAKESKLVNDIQETIVAGIAQVNDRLRHLVERLETDRPDQAGAPPASDPASSGPATQQVPIERDPATGETTRLDDDISKTP